MRLATKASIVSPLAFRSWNPRVPCWDSSLCPTTARPRSRAQGYPDRAHRHTTRPATFEDSVDASARLERVDVAGLSPSDVRQVVDFTRPCILTGILPSRDCEAWCDALMEDLGDAEVDFQVKNNADGHSEVFQSSLGDFICGLQEESCHDSSW